MKDYFSGIRSLRDTFKKRGVEEPPENKDITIKDENVELTNEREFNTTETVEFQLGVLRRKYKDNKDMLNKLDRLESLKAKAKYNERISSGEGEPPYVYNKSGQRIYNFRHPSYNNPEVTWLEMKVQNDILHLVMGVEDYRRLNAGLSDFKSQLLLYRTFVKHRKEIELLLRGSIIHETRDNINCLLKGNEGAFVRLNCRVPYTNGILLIEPKEVTPNTALDYYVDMVNRDPYSFPYNEYFSSIHNNPIFPSTPSIRKTEFKNAMKEYVNMSMNEKLNKRQSKIYTYRGTRPVSHSEVKRVLSANLPHIDLCYNVGEKVKQLVLPAMTGEYDLMFSTKLNIEVPYHEYLIMDDIENNVLEFESLEYPSVKFNEHTEFISDTPTHLVFRVTSNNQVIGISKYVSYDRFGFNNNILEALYVRDDQLEEAFELIRNREDIVLDFTRTKWYCKEKKREDLYSFKECSEKVNSYLKGEITPFHFELQPHLDKALEKRYITPTQYNALKDKLN